MIFIGLVIFILVAIAFITPAIKMHSMLDCRSESDEYDTKEFGIDSKTLSLMSVDGYALTAYEVAVDNPRGVVICLGGIHSPTVTNWYGHSSLFAEVGFASILLDLRAHGKSEGDKICAATEEWKDVDAVVDYIRSQEFYNGVPIIVMGLSMGAATAVVSIGRNSNIDGLISLSSYSSWQYNFNRNVEQRLPKFIARLLAPFVNMTSYLRFGHYSDISPVNEIKKLGSRPALLVHATGDKIVPYASFLQLSQAAPTAQTWVINSDNHCIIDDFVHPKTDPLYCDKVINFLTTNF